LREDLLVAADGLLDEGVSPDVISLRQVARRAGVSPMAPYRHFESSQALLGEVLTRRFQRFSAALCDGIVVEDLTPAAARSRLAELGARYVQQGRANLVAYHALFDSSLIAPEPADLPGVGLFATAVALISTCPGPLEPRSAARMFWCGLHGIVCLPGRAALVGWDADHTLVADLVRLVAGPAN
jgi:AcrR family transcriptional regulator